MNPYPLNINLMPALPHYSIHGPDCPHRIWNYRSFKFTAVLHSVQTVSVGCMILILSCQSPSCPQCSISQDASVLFNTVLLVQHLAVRWSDATT